MGIPSFVKFLKSNIPNLYIPLKKMKRAVNNLYVDMNYIINKVLQSHPIKGQAPTQDEIKVIIEEIENILIECIKLYKPKNLLYLALDGTLPRAKLNHFRQVAQLNELDQILDIENKQKILKKWSEDKKEINEEIKQFADQKQTVPFLQPGSEFLHQICEHLRQNFLTKQINEEWSELKVIFSDDKVPLEFEQKVFEFIRAQTSSQNYKQKDTHFIISSDADSISYSLPLSDAYIFVSQQAQDTENIIQIYEIQKFLIEKYLGDYDNTEKKDQLINSKKGKERIFHDFVLIFFFLGNEFLPSLPNLENKLRSMYHLMDCYKKFLLHMDKLNPIVTEDFHISLPRLQEYIYVVSSTEFQFLSDERKKMHLTQSADLTKTKQNLDQRNTKQERESMTPLEQFKLDLEILEFENPKKQYPTTESYLNDKENYANLYYADKFQKSAEEITYQFVQEVCQNYLEGILWTFEYFVRGCISWNWYFQYKYVPFPSNLRDSFADFNFPIFEKGVQYKPMFQQLFTYSKLSVPSVLPKSLYKVIEKDLSDLYPTELKLENQGKYYFKQSIVQNLVNLDDNQLKQALATAESEFSPEEKARNTISKNPRFFTTQDCGSEKIFEQEDYTQMRITGIFQSIGKEGKVSQYKFKVNAPTPAALQDALQESEKQQQKEEEIIRKQKDQKFQAKQELQSKQPCKYANNCFKLQHGTCPFYHTEQEIADKDKPKQKLCIKGDDCAHYKKGTCNYYHPK